MIFIVHGDKLCWCYDPVKGCGAHDGVTPDANCVGRVSLISCRPSKLRSYKEGQQQCSGEH